MAESWVEALAAIDETLKKANSTEIKDPIDEFGDEPGWTEMR